MVVAVARAMDGKHKDEIKVINSLIRHIEWTDDAGKITVYNLKRIHDVDKFNGYGNVWIYDFYQNKGDNNG